MSLRNTFHLNLLIIFTRGDLETFAYISPLTHVNLMNFGEFSNLTQVFLTICSVGGGIRFFPYRPTVEPV